MDLSSSRFRAFAVSMGFSFWFFIITSALGIFSIEFFTIFLIVIFPLMQLLSIKISKALDVVALFNTKLFLGILFVGVISVYGIFFTILRLDLLRLKEKGKS